MSIYDRIGGADAVQAAVEQFYVRVLGDPTLEHYFAGVDIPQLKAHQRAFIAAALGGPQLFAGRDMAAAHAGLNIADADFDTVVGHLVATLQDLGVPDAEIAEIGATLEPLRAQIVAVP